MILMIQLEKVFSVAETHNGRGYQGTLLVPIQSFSCLADPTKMVGWHALTQAHFPWCTLPLSADLGWKLPCGEGRDGINV